MAAPSDESDGLLTRKTQTLVRKAHELGFESLTHAAINRYELASQTTTPIVQEGVGLVRAIIQSPQLVHMRKALAKDHVFKTFMEECAVERVRNEMQSIAQNPNLRLPGSTLSPDVLENFSFAAIDKEHTRSAPFMRTILKAASNSDDCWAPADNDSNEDVDLEDNMRPQAENLHQEANAAARWRRAQTIRVVSLCMLSYANSERSNVLQMVLGYYSFAQNVKKRCVEVLHRLGVLVSYETIRVILKFNASAVKTRLKELVWQDRFFLSFDNMNFYARVRDQRLHNKNRQINFTAGYICKMSTNAATDETNWDQTWLAADQSQHALAETVVSKDFLLQSNDIQH